MTTISGGSDGHRLKRVWITLNASGCVKNESMAAEGGGVLRDSKGNWISGYATNLGDCSMEEVELWALCHGFRVTWSKRVSIPSC